MPDSITSALRNYGIETLSELRFRTGFPIFCIISGKKFYFNVNKLTDKKDNAMLCEKKHIEYIIERVTDRSFYAFNEQIKQGYLTTADGVRIGIAGDCVFSRNEITTIKNVTSLNVRIPHEIKGCADTIYNKIFNSGIYSTLLISPPAKGKTTMLKDLAASLNAYKNEAILLIDERGEFATVKGENIDMIRFSDKYFAFKYGLRSLSPNILITDELQGQNDWICVQNAVLSGIKVIASCHGKDINDLLFSEYFKKRIFERYVFLDDGKAAGVIKKIYDEEFNEL